MEPFIVWYGLKQTLRGNDVSSVTEVEFRGEFLGRTCFPNFGGDESGTDTIFYRAANGWVVVHVVRWSRVGNSAQADLYVYKTFEEAKTNFRIEMARAGIIPARRITLEEYVAEDETPV